MKSLSFIILLIPIIGLSQPKNWHHADPTTDNLLGVSSERAYERLGVRSADTVIVAVLDNGIELTHEDLQGLIWTNPGEIPGNFIDDDSNGYIDDINGWNFLGNQNGNVLKLETISLTRIYQKLSLKYQTWETPSIAIENLNEYKHYLSIKNEFEQMVNNKKHEIAQLKHTLVNFKEHHSNISAHLGKELYTIGDLKRIRKRKPEIANAKNFLLDLLLNDENEESIKTRIAVLEKELETRLNPNFNNREEMVGDNPDDLSDSIYGNNILDAKGPFHGTAVSGIIGALQNGIGVDGIAKHVKIMVLRIVPNGDERDKDIALAFKYAIRNGAKIISCSFAKKYSLHPEFIQKAISEAEKAGVLIVHAAGNWASDNDSVPYHPIGLNTKGLKASNFITVGASTHEDSEHLVAHFSNYGQKSVDIFAPGYNINLCGLNNSYGLGSGTSMAAPIVSGIAAVLMGHFPTLSASQIKAIIMESAYHPNTQRVLLPGNYNMRFVNFSELSVSGGIANLYRAIDLIEKKHLAKNSH